MIVIHLDCDEADEFAIADTIESVLGHTTFNYSVSVEG